MAARPEPGFWTKAWAVVKVLIYLYIFLCALRLMGDGFESFGGGKGHVHEGPLGWFFDAAGENPFVGLFAGILVTSIVQSSSVTTSAIVMLVASGVLDVRTAVPMVMGANIGTTVTCAIVSLTHVRHRPDFRRAYSAASIHDFFNIMAVLILLPLEIFLHPLERMATGIGEAASWVSLGWNVKYANPVKMAVEPTVGFLRWLLAFVLPEASVAMTVVLIVLGLILIFVALARMTGIMKSILLPQLERLLDGVLLKRAMLAMLLGCAFTALIQSSSVTTSLMVPLVAAGVVSLRKVFPFILGANVGTTVTALLGSMAAGTPEGVNWGFVIATVHLLFNLAGILIIYGIKPLREVPILLAEGMAAAVAKRRSLAIVYIGVVFFILPLALILLSQLAKR